MFAPHNSTDVRATSRLVEDDPHDDDSDDAEDRDSGRTSVDVDVVALDLALPPIVELALLAVTALHALVPVQARIACASFAAIRSAQEEDRWAVGDRIHAGRVVNLSHAMRGATRHACDAPSAI